MVLPSKLLSSHGMNWAACNHWCDSMRCCMLCRAQSPTTSQSECLHYAATQSYLALSAQQKSVFIFWVKLLSHVSIWGYSFQKVRRDKPSLLVQLSLQDQDSVPTSGFLAEAEINRGAGPCRGGLREAQGHTHVGSILRKFHNSHSCLLSCGTTQNAKTQEITRRKADSEPQQIYSRNTETSKL